MSFAIPQGLTWLLLIGYLICGIYIIRKASQLNRANKISGSAFLLILFASILLPVIGMVGSYFYLRGRMKQVS